MKGAFLLLTALLGACGRSTGSDDVLVLVTEDEAGMADAELPDRGDPSTSTGPLLRFNAPTNGSRVSAPFTIDIAAEAGPSGREPDMETLRVRLLKGVKINVTGRLLPYLEGKQIRYEGATAPSGTYAFDVYIEDEVGNATLDVFQFEVGG